MSEYPASLRQQVRWIKEAIDPATDDDQRIELQDVDCDEIEEAAAHIEMLERAREDDDKLSLSLIARVEAAEAKLAKAREGLESIDAVAIDYGHLESAARTMKELAARAYKEINE